MPFAVLAQDQPPVIIGTKQSIHSSILNESRELQISAPSTSTISHPLILVFDGEGLFEPVASAVHFMNRYSEMPQMPEAVVVGIVNTDRGRDMPRPQQYGGGGEEAFSKFISTELIPSLKKQYQLNGHVIVIGHSQGAYFASYLVATAPEQYSWAIAIDAPMNVEQRMKHLNEKLVKSINDTNKLIRYASIEAVFGWGEVWKNYFTRSNRAMQLILSGETHESVAYKGVYEGLHFLFNDFTPPKKDLKLSELKAHYDLISKTYGYTYEIPFRVLRASMSYKQLENRKQELIDLATYAERKYGSSTFIENMKNSVSTMTTDGATLLDHYLTLPHPTAEQIRPFVGKWSGEESRKQVQPPGSNFPNPAMSLTLDIRVEQNKSLLYRVNPPWSPGKSEALEIFHVTKDGELIFGRRNRGGGVIITKARINKEGKLAGETLLEGFNIPVDMPDDGKKFHEFIMKNPSTFELVRE